MRKIIPYIVLILMIASILAPVSIGYASETIQPGLPIAEARPLIADSQTWSIAPCKYWYYDWMPNEARVGTTISNLSDKEAEFNLGDGNIVSIRGSSSMEHKYIIILNGNIVRIPITKTIIQATGLNIVEQLNLKIVPKS